MSFSQLNAIFVAVAVLVMVAALLPGPWRATKPAGGTGTVIAAVVGTHAVLVVLTAIFDNVMIASGLFDYAQDTLQGFRVGLAPIEDFAYPLAAGLLLPGLWLLFTRGRRR
ncbi:lycopene cyclase domain-containing protein [Arthrobacter sp. TMN-49]